MPGNWLTVIYWLNYIFAESLIYFIVILCFWNVLGHWFTFWNWHVMSFLSFKYLILDNIFIFESFFLQKKLPCREWDIFISLKNWKFFLNNNLLGLCLVSYLGELFCFRKKSYEQNRNIFNKDQNYTEKTLSSERAVLI